MKTDSDIAENAMANIKVVTEIIMPLTITSSRFSRANDETRLRIANRPNPYDNCESHQCSAPAEWVKPHPQLPVIRSMTKQFTSIVIPEITRAIVHHRLELAYAPKAAIAKMMIEQSSPSRFGRTVKKPNGIANAKKMQRSATRMRNDRSEN